MPKSIITVYEYEPLASEDFRRALDELGLTCDEFSRITGAGAPNRVILWYSGKEDIPKSVRGYLALFYRDRGNIEFLRQLADLVAVPRNREIVKGVQHPKGGPAQDTDAVISSSRNRDEFGPDGRRKKFFNLTRR